MATTLGKSVFWGNKETVSQCNGQSLDPVVFKNLVIHFNQEKFRELHSEGSSVLHARKHRTIFVAKASKHNPALAERATGRASSQLLSASTEATGSLRKDSQVPYEPKTSLLK